jgi:hypothetical protein
MGLSVKTVFIRGMGKQDEELRHDPGHQQGLLEAEMTACAGRRRSGPGGGGQLGVGFGGKSSAFLHRAVMRFG